MGQAFAGGVCERLDAEFGTLAGHKESEVLPGGHRVRRDAGAGGWAL